MRTCAPCRRRRARAVVLFGTAGADYEATDMADLCARRPGLCALPRQSKHRPGHAADRGAQLARGLCRRHVRPGNRRLAGNDCRPGRQLCADRAALERAQDCWRSNLSPGHGEGALSQHPVAARDAAELSPPRASGLSWADQRLSRKLDRRNIERRTTRRKSVADEVIFVGATAHKARASLGRCAAEENSAPSTAWKAASAYLKDTALAGEVILVKSASNLHLERLMLDWVDGVRCWPNECGNKSSCFDCGLYRSPFSEHSGRVQARQDGVCLALWGSKPRAPALLSDRDVHEPEVADDRPLTRNAAWPHLPYSS